jgi:hypothetical protein
MTAVLAVVLASVAIPMTAAASTTQPVQASAPQPTGWPKAYNEKASDIVAFADDKVATINCASSNAYDTMVFTDYGATSPASSVVPPNSVSKSTCYDYGVNNGTSSYAVASDGSMYTDQNPSGNEHTVAKFKNGRQVWATPSLTSPTNCYPYSPYTSYDLAMASMSIGPDGNLYGILKSTTSPSACGEWLVGYDSTNGDELFRVQLQTSSYNGITPRVWTYASTILVMDSSGMVREFNYSGVEDTSKQYTFTPPSGTYLDSIYTIANADMRVFAVFTSSGSPTATQVAFHDSDGTNGSMSTSFYGPVSGLGWYLGAGGELVATVGAYIIHFDIADNTSTTYTMALPSGDTNQALMNYSEDTDGVMVLTRQVWTSGTSYTNAIRVDTIDPTTSALTNIFNLQADSGVSFDPSLFSRTVYGNSLYMTVCYSGATCTGNPSTQDLSLYKVALTGVGDVLSSDNAQASYTSTELNYVAMGDSFSSGEGNPDFNPWTDRSGVDQCHRSLDTSYPEWLAQHGGLNLDLVDYVACSGATTDDLLNGGSGDGAWDEPAQVSALTTSTDRVTLTISGNDVGFVPVMTACATSSGWGCSADATLNSDLTSRLDALACTTSCAVVDNPDGHAIHSIRSVIGAIASAAPNASIYIAGYPHLFGDSTENFTENADAPGGASCGGPVGQLFSYTDTQWINGEIDTLDATINNAVTDAQGDGINVTYVAPTLFSGHGLCDSGTSWINDVDLTGVYPTETFDPGSLHPDGDGQTLGYALMFQAAM